MTPRNNHRLTDAELAWLWPRYQRCTFPVASFPKRFARNTLDRLTEAGRLMACDLAFQYRRQIFGKHAAKWGFGQFVAEVSARAPASSPVSSPTHVPGSLLLHL